MSYFGPTKPRVGVQYTHDPGQKKNNPIPLTHRSPASHNHRCLQTIICSALAEFWCTDFLSWWRHCHSLAVLEEQRPETLIHQLVHDWTVPVMFHVGCEALANCNAFSVASLLVCNTPIIEAVQACSETHGCILCHKIDERIIQIHTGREIGGPVNKIIHPTEALIIKQSQELISRVTAGDIAHQNCCLRIRCLTVGLRIRASISCGALTAGAATILQRCNCLFWPRTLR